jgi:hypothetical protein
LHSASVLEWPRSRRRRRRGTTIPCLAITWPNTATTDGDPREPLTDANAIAEGDAETETPSFNTN